MDVLGGILEIYDDVEEETASRVRTQRRLYLVRLIWRKSELVLSFELIFPLEPFRMSVQIMLSEQLFIIM